MRGGKRGFTIKLTGRKKKSGGGRHEGGTGSTRRPPQCLSILVRGVVCNQNGMMDIRTTHPTKPKTRVRCPMEVLIIEKAKRGERELGRRLTTKQRKRANIENVQKSTASDRHHTDSFMWRWYPGPVAPGHISTIKKVMLKIWGGESKEDKTAKAQHSCHKRGWGLGRSRSCKGRAQYEDLTNSLVQNPHLTNRRAASAGASKKKVRTCKCVYQERKDGALAKVRARQQKVAIKNQGL